MHDLLSGVLVVEVTTAWAGPFVGRTLGAFGADVIKIEAPNAIDIWRGPFPLGWGTTNIPKGRDRRERSVDVAPNFNSLNRNKLGAAIDLADPRGRDLFLRLIQRADVVVANLTERVLPNLGLATDRLRESNPRLIVLNMPALGASGPYKGAAGYGTIIEGMGGLAARFGYRHEQARVSPNYYPDPVAGIHATLAVVAALAHRERTGTGCLIDLSQQEAMWLQLGEGIALAAREDREPQRLGNAEPGCVPSGVYPTSDGGFVAIVARSPGELAAISRRVEGLQATQRDEIDAAMAAWTSTRTREDLVRELSAAGIGVAPVFSVAEAVASAADALEEIDHPVTGVLRYPRVPARIDDAPVSSRRFAPPFGHDTDRVLSDYLQIGEAERADLARDGVTGGRPVLLGEPD